MVFRSNWPSSVEVTNVDNKSFLWVINTIRYSLDFDLIGMASYSCLGEPNKRKITPQLLYVRCAQMAGSAIWPSRLNFQLCGNISSTEAMKCRVYLNKSANGRILMKEYVISICSRTPCVFSEIKAHFAAQYTIKVHTHYNSWCRSKYSLTTYAAHVSVSDLAANKTKCPSSLYTTCYL